MPEDQGSWTLLTAHGRALVAIAQDPGARMRDLAEVVGVTERTVQVIVADLEAAGYVAHTRVGRRNRYTVDLARPFRHSAQDGLQVGPFLNLLSDLPPDTDQDRTDHDVPGQVDGGEQADRAAAHRPRPRPSGAPVDQPSGPGFIR